jgi:hypothetical protein
MAKNTDKCASLRQARQLQSGALDRVSDQNRQKRRCLFRAVPLARALCGTKMGKKAHFCYSLLQARGLSL